MITIQKNIRFYDGRKYEKLLIRQYTHRDVAGLLSLQKECFPSPFPQELLWSKEQLHSHIETFQEGALCALVNDVIIGSDRADCPI